MKSLRNLQLGVAFLGLAVFSAPADDTHKAPDRSENWVPTSELKIVLAQHPHAVLLSREQYEALLRDAKKTLTPGAEPPVRATLTSARYNGELSGDVIDVQAEFTVNVLSDNWSEVPLRLGALALGDIKLDGNAAFSANGGAATLLIHGKGEHKITAEFMVPVKKDSGISSVQLCLPRASAGLFTFNVPPGTEVESTQPIDLKKNPGATTVSLPVAEQNDVMVSWHGTGDSQQGAAILFQENSYIYSIDETRVQADLGIVLNAALGSLPASLQIKIPAGSTPLQVVGSEVLKWTAANDVLSVDLTPGDRKTVGIRVLLETPSQIAPATTSLPLPEVAGVRRSAGKFAVIGSRGVKIKEIAAGDGAVQAEGIFDSSIERDERFISGYGFAVQPSSVKVSIEKVTPRFSADLDTLAEFKREAIFIERTLALHGEEGEIFETNIVMSEGEELISVRNEDNTEPDWKADGANVKIRWSEGLDSGAQRIFRIKSRMEPAKWPETDQVALVDMKIPGAEKINGYIAVQADKMFRVETASVDGLEKRDGRTTPVKGDFAWFRREAFTLQLKLSRRAPELQATLLGYALPVDGALDVHGQLNFNILYSGVNKLRVKVPAASAEQFYFDGAQIAERNRDGDTWTIVLQKEITGDYALKFHAVVPFDESHANFNVNVPDVEPLDVKQQNGTWAIEANTSTEITFNTTGMNELDPLHAPALPDYQPRHHVIGVYGYLGLQHSLKLEGVKHEAAPILTAVADSLDLDTVVSTSGAERHRALFYIRTVGDQFLDVTMPQGSNVWSLTVDGRPLKPVSEKPDVVRVQLPATLDRTRATHIQLVYETRRHEWSNSGGYDLAAPRLDARIPVLQSHWQVWLPDGFTYTAFDSNLKKNETAADTTPLLIAPFEWIKRSVFSRPPPAASSAPQDENKLLADAEAYFTSGRYDLAYKRYDQVLAIDPNNATARAGQKKVDEARIEYADQSYDTTRSYLNWKVEQGWDLPPRKYVGHEIVGIDLGTSVARSDAYVRNKLNSIIIPRLELREASLADAVEFLHRKSVELDNMESDPARKGVNIVLKQNPNAAGSPITLSLANIPLVEALRYITSLAGMKTKIDPYAVTIVPLDYGTDVLVTKEYRVPPGFLKNADGSVQTAHDFLLSAGVAFPAGATADYLPATGRMIVRNTQGNLDLVDQICDAAMETAPPTEEDAQRQRDAAQAAAEEARNSRFIQKKLSRIIIPKIEFRDASVRDALEYLSRKAVEVDATESDPGRKGVNIIFKEGVAANQQPNSPATAPGDQKITLSLVNVPLDVAIRYITNLAGLKAKIDPYAVNIVPLSEPTDTLVTKEYKVPPGFLSTSGAMGGAGGPNAPEAASSIPKRMTALDYLKSAGVEFPPGASANFLPGSSKLIVRNTEANLDLVDQITEATSAATNMPPGGMAGEQANPNTADQPVFDTRKMPEGMPEAQKSAGLLPMKLELEHTGRQFSFDGFYAAERVSFHYVDWWSQARRGWIWWVAGGIAFFAMAGFGAWRRLVWGALVLTFIPICVAQSLTGMCNALLIGWITGFLIYQIATRLVFRRRVVVEVPAV